MAVAGVDSVWFSVNVETPSTPRVVYNTAFVAAKSDLSTAFDQSTNGINPDKNGNKDASDDKEATQFAFGVIQTEAMFIPEIGRAHD